MKPDYRNWMPKGMIMGLGTAAGVLAVGSAATVRLRLPWARTSRHLAGAVLGLGAVGCLAGAAWSLYARAMFSYEGGRQLSRQIIEGIAAYIELPESGVGLDVGCGSGALTIACAKRNPPRAAWWASTAGAWNTHPTAGNSVSGMPGQRG